MPYCECGCGAEIAEGRRFVKGHTWKGRRLPPSRRKNINERPKYTLGTTIDWRWLVVEFNKRYGTLFKNEKQFYLGVYPRLSPSKIAKCLGVSDMTIYKRLDYYKIERSHKRGGANHKKKTKKWAVFMGMTDDEVAGMTIPELTECLDVHETTVYNWLHLADRTYAQRKREDVHNEYQKFYVCY